MSGKVDRGAALIPLLVIITIGAALVAATLDRVVGGMQPGTSNIELVLAEDVALSARDLAIATNDLPAACSSADLVHVSIGTYEPTVVCQLEPPDPEGDGSVFILLTATIGDTVLQSRVRLDPAPTVVAQRYLFGSG